MNLQKLFCPYCGKQLECPESLKGCSVQCPLCSSCFVYGEAQDEKMQQTPPGEHDASRGKQEHSGIEKTRQSQPHMVSWNVVILAAILVVGAIITAVMLREKQSARLSVDLTTISLLQEENARLKRELAETRKALALPDIDAANQILELQRENLRLKRERKEYPMMH